MGLERLRLGLEMEFGSVTTTLFERDLCTILSSTVRGVKTLDTEVRALLRERSIFGINE